MTGPREFASGGWPSRPTPTFARPGTVVPVALGDAVVLGAFVTFGLYSHNILLWEHPGYAARTFLPFLLGWLVVAPLAGAYASRVLTGWRAALGWTALAWGGATLVGGAIRASPFFHGGAPPDFLLVNFAIGLAFLLPWRASVAIVGARRIP